MTKAKLRANVISIILMFLGLFVAASVCKFIPKCEKVYELLKDFSSLLISAAAAYLAYCFQRRQAFLISLRDLWKEMVEAKGKLIQYTHHPAPDHASFGDAHQAISKTVDLVRGVYRNVGETDTLVGLYPFQPLHDMRASMDRLGFVGVTPFQQIVAREEILRSWNALRWAFLKEFSTPEPPQPITEYNAVDPRRSITPGR